jgi:hypothetical protein
MAIDLIDVFCHQSIIGIDPINVFLPSVLNHGGVGVLDVLFYFKDHHLGFC